MHRNFSIDGSPNDTSIELMSCCMDYRENNFIQIGAYLFFNLDIISVTHMMTYDLWK